MAKQTKTHTQHKPTQKSNNKWDTFAKHTIKSLGPQYVKRSTDQ